MPKRFTDSEKWKDPWFHKLPPTSKLFFLYLCDQCDIAGFWEIDMERAIFDTGLSTKTLASAMEDLESRYESNGTHLWIKRFIEFQGNYPFNEKVGVHKGIIRLLKEREEFSNNITRLLNGEGLPNSYEGLNKGLFNPTSNSISNSKGNSKGQGQKITPLVETEDLLAANQVIDYLNEKANTRFQHSVQSQKHIRARLQAGATVEDCCLIIDHKLKWLHDEDMAEYLRPITLFSSSKFEGYLTAAIRWDQNGRRRTKEEKLARNKAIAKMGSALYDTQHNEAPPEMIEEALGDGGNGNG